MKILVDTHLLIWATCDSAKLSNAARSALQKGGCEYYFSAASIWEIAIKRARHSDAIPISAADARKLFVAAGYVELPVGATQAEDVETLPPIHSDPFDRILVAQAKIDGMTLLTHDHLLPPYGDFVKMV